MSTLTLKGPYDDNYLKTDEFGVETTVWSPCGQAGSLNINSEVRITPLDSKKSSLLTVGYPPVLEDLLKDLPGCHHVRAVFRTHAFADPFLFHRSTPPISSSLRSTTSSGSSAPSKGLEGSLEGENTGLCSRNQERTAGHDGTQDGSHVLTNFPVMASCIPELATTCGPPKYHKYIRCWSATNTIF